MKKTIKTLLLVGLMTGIGSSAFAQLGEKENIAVSALILKQIKIIGAPINFSVVPAGNIAYIDPINPANNNQVAILATPGRLEVEATSEQIIKIDWPATINLKEADSTRELTYQPKLSITWGAYSISSTERGSSLLLENDDAFTATSTVTSTTPNATGIGGLGYFSTAPSSATAHTQDFATIFVGGSLFQANNVGTPIPATGAEGSYTGNITFNINYTGL